MPSFAIYFGAPIEDADETMAIAQATAVLLDATVDVEVLAEAGTAVAALLDIDQSAIQAAMEAMPADAALLDAAVDLLQPLTLIAANAAMLSGAADIEILLEAMAAAALLLDLELEAYEIWGELRREIDPADWSGSPVVAYLEVLAKTPDALSPYRAYFYNETDGLVVAGSDVSTASLDKVRVRSGSFAFAAGTKVYRVEFLSGHPMFDAVVIVDVG